MLRQLHRPYNEEYELTGWF